MPHDIEIVAASCPKNMSRSRLFKQYLRFCMVGGSGVIVDMAVLSLLASPERLAWDLTLSKVIAAEVAILNNFVWNDVWTFQGDGGWRAKLMRFGKFNLICTAGIGLSVLLLNAQVRRLGMNIYVANAFAILAVSIWNFFLNLRFGWKQSP